jgi:hypothetical protein
MDCLTVAALGAITDYSDVTLRGYLKDHPEWVNYRQDVLAWMIATVRAQAEAEIAAGSWKREWASWGLPKRATTRRWPPTQPTPATASGASTPLEVMTVRLAECREPEHEAG